MVIIRSAALVFGLKRLLELTRTPSTGREDTIGKPALLELLGGLDDDLLPVLSPIIS